MNQAGRHLALAIILLGTLLSPGFAIANQPIELFFLFDDSGSMNSAGLMGPAQASAANLLRSTANEFSALEAPQMNLFFMNETSRESVPHPFTGAIDYLESVQLSGGQTYFIDPLEKIATIIASRQTARESRVFIFTDGRPSEWEISQLVPKLSQTLQLATSNSTVHIQFTAFGKNMDSVTKMNLQNLQSESDRFNHGSFKLVLVENAQELQITIESYSKVVSLQQKIERLKQIVARLQEISGMMKAQGLIFSEIEGSVSSQSDLSNEIVVDLDKLLLALGSIETEYMQLMEEFKQLMTELREADQSIKNQISGFKKTLENIESESTKVAGQRDQLVKDVYEFQTRVFGEGPGQKNMQDKGITPPSKHEPLHEGSSRLDNNQTPKEARPLVFDLKEVRELNGPPTPEPLGDVVKASTSRDKRVKLAKSPQRASTPGSPYDPASTWRLRVNMELVRLQFDAMRLRESLGEDVNRSEIFEIAKKRFDQALRAENLLAPSDSLESEFQLVSFGSPHRPLAKEQVYRLESRVAALQEMIDSHLIAQASNESSEEHIQQVNSEILQLKTQIDTFKRSLQQIDNWAFRLAPGEDTKSEKRLYQIYDAINDQVFFVTARFALHYSRSRSLFGRARNSFTSFFAQRSMVEQLHLHALEPESSPSPQQSLADFLESEYSTKLRLVSMNRGHYDEVVQDRVGKMISMVWLSESNEDFQSCFQIMDIGNTHLASRQRPGPVRSDCQW